jgi:hypothetical protein
MGKDNFNHINYNTKFGSEILKNKKAPHFCRAFFLKLVPPKREHTLPSRPSGIRPSTICLGLAERLKSLFGMRRGNLPAAINAIIHRIGTLKNKKAPHFCRAFLFKIGPA